MENEIVNGTDDLSLQEAQEAARNYFWRETCDMFFSMSPYDMVFFGSDLADFDVNDVDSNVYGYNFRDKKDINKYFCSVTEYRGQLLPNTNPLQPHSFYMAKLKKLTGDKKYLSLKNIRTALKKTADKHDVFAREMCKQFENFVRYSGTNQGIFKHVLVRNCAYLYKYASQDAKNDGIWRDPYNYNFTNDNNSGCCLKRVLEWIKEIIF